MKETRQHKAQKANDVYWGNLIISGGLTIAASIILYMVWTYPHH